MKISACRRLRALKFNVKAIPLICLGILISCQISFWGGASALLVQSILIVVVGLIWGFFSRQVFTSTQVLYLKYPNHIPIGTSNLADKILSSCNNSSSAYSLLSGEVMLDLWRAWREINNIELGYPASLHHVTTTHFPGETNPKEEVCLAFFPFHWSMSPLHLHFDVTKGEPPKLFKIQTITYDRGNETFFTMLKNILLPGSKEPDELFYAHMFTKRYKIPNESDTLWEASLASAFLYMDIGIEKESIDLYFFHGDSAWRKYYERKNQRIVRRSNNRPALIDDDWWTKH